MYEEILNQNPLGIFLWEKDGKIQFANPKALKLINWDKPLQNQKQICSETDLLEEIKLLEVLDLGVKQHLTYNKVFSSTNDERFTMDVMTHIVQIQDTKYYCSQIRPHKKESTQEHVLRKQNQILLKLAKSESIDSGDLDLALREMTEASTLALDCERSSVWFYHNGNSSILSSDLYQKLDNTHSNGVELFAKDFPAYFKYLSEERSLGAHNAHTDPSTYEFSDVYLKPLNIHSMLDAPIRSHGKMVGVICNETVGRSKVWSQEEMNFAGSIADLISRALEAQSRKKAEDEIKKINEELEQKVLDQTKQIRESLQEITSIKEYQDGDYFLTSLILNPLMTNNNDSEKVITDFLIKQKKQFRFRKNMGQIGGDFCITHKIKFLSTNEPFIFLLNADAMGKSMQGASGAIVLGTTILNVLMEIETVEVIAKKSPREWLEYIIIELNNIFLTFNGSMLISGFFGLIGEKNYELLYANLEHPNPVLYRDGKASFLSQDLYYQKIGTKQLDSIQIQKTLLSSGDTLFIGSDGKDDIQLQDINGKIGINEDETLFLKIVENSEGNLNTIYYLVRDKGNLIDDFSLMKVQLN
jgi:hypothetical protein